jgi:polyhydroxyalkanoate synthase
MMAALKLRDDLQQVADKIIDKVDPVGFGQALATEATGLAKHPVATARALLKWTTATMAAARASASRVVGATPDGPMAVPAKDRRFADKIWSENPIFFWLMQQHLLRERLSRDLLDAASLDDVTARKARVAGQLLVDALAPTSFFLTNPTALKRAFDTGGVSAIRGMQKWLEDVRTRQGWPRLVDTSGFTVGENLAATPGKVVYRNQIMEVIQYSPQTESVFAVPLLCSPPFINKYYIMDLAPGRSFVEWAVQQGHTTFCISYRNPDASLRDAGFEDYLLEGVLTALRVVKEITGAPKVNVAALCVGGTLASMLGAYLEATGDDSLGSLTLMNTLVDFSEPGPLGAFTDRPTVERLLRRVSRAGMLESHEMSRTFNMLRPNDLHFNYVASSWMMGDEPPGFDLLAWNDDATRIPARLLSDYLSGCYLDNKLAQEELEVGGKKLRLMSVRADAFVVGAVEDHITPWRSVFQTAHALGGEVEFVLSSSGHIAGVVNPPSKNAAYWSRLQLDADADAWQGAATRNADTWWRAWAGWIEKRAGKKVPAPKAPGSAKHGAIADAPGAYVLER